MLSKGLLSTNRPGRYYQPFGSKVPRSAKSPRPQYKDSRQGLYLQRCTGPQDEGTRLLEEDMRRYKAREESSRGGQAGPSNQPPEGDGNENSVKNLLDKVLIGDFFFVLLALAWLGLGVAEKTTLSSSILLDAWFPLWALIFQPAIGVLMLGALVSGGIGWLQSKNT